MEINGGSLRYTAEMDISKLKAALKEGEKGYQGFSDVVGKTGDEMDKAFENAQKVIEVQKKSIAELERKYKELQDTISKTPADTGNVAVTEEIERLKKEIEGYKTGMADMQTVIESFTNKNTVLTKELEALKQKLLEVGKVQTQNQKITDTFDVTTENIRIQKDVIAELEKQYKDLQKAIEGMAPGQAQATQIGVGNRLAVEIEAEKKALKELEEFVGENAVKHETLRQKLIQVKNEMISLVAAGQRDSVQYQELSQRAEEYQQAIDDVNGTMNALRGNTGLNALVDTLGLASSGLAIFQGLSALTAGENENLEKIMVKLQATMAVAIGLQQLQNSVTRQGGIIDQIKAVQALARARAETLAAAATGRATIAQRIFNVVAKANPYILLAAAIMTVVGALIIFSSKTNKAIEDQKALTKATADGAAEQIIAYKGLQAQWNQLGDDLKAKEKFIKDNQEEFHKLGIEVTNVSEAENALVRNTAAVVESIMLRAKATAEMQLAQEAWKEYITNYDKVMENNKTYNNDYFGDINKSINDFGKEVLGIGDMTVSQLSEKYQDFNNLVNSSVKNTKDAADALSKAGIKAYVPEEKVKKEKVKKDKELAEIYDLGSVVKLQQQIALLDNSMRRMGKDGEVALRMIDKYGKEYTSKTILSLQSAKDKRLQLAKELSEAERRIRTEALQQEIERNEKEWEQYYSAIEVLDKVTADGIYSDLVKKSQNHLAYVEKMQSALIKKSESGVLTEAEKEDLAFLTAKIRELNSEQAPLDKFKENIDASLRSLPSLIDQMELLNKVQEDEFAKEGGNTNLFLAEKRYLEERKREILQQQKDTYQEFLNEQKTFEAKKIEIEKKYTLIRDQIAKNQALTDTERLRQLNASYKAEGKEITDINLEGIRKTDLWIKGFGDLQIQGIRSLKNIKKGFQDLLLSGKVTEPTEIKAIQDQILKIEETIGSRNPFEAIGLAIEKYKKQRQELNAIDKNSEKGLEKYKSKLEDVNQSFVNIIEVVGVAANALIDIVGTIGDAFGGLSDELKQTLAEVQQLVEGIVNVVAGYFSGNYGQMISGIVQIVSSMVKLLSGDKYREKQIKEWQRAVEGLKSSYDELSNSIQRTAGEASISMNRGLIENLEEQKRLLTQMRDEESKKKKADKDKIAGFDSQISQINEQIKSVLEQFKQSVTTTDFKQLSDNLANALIEAFGQGEDAATAFDKVVDDVMKNAVINALKIKYIQPLAEEFIEKFYKTLGYGNDTSNVDGNNALIKQYEDQIKELEKQMAVYTGQGYSPGNTAVLNDLDTKKKKLLELIGKLKAEMASNPVGGIYDGLTEEEVTLLKEGYKNDPRLKAVIEGLKGIDQIFDTAFEGANSIKGDIKGITEKTAGALEAQINAMRINQVSGLQVARQSLLNLVQIEVNTRNLFQIRKDISEMNSKMTKSLAGVP